VTAYFFLPQTAIPTYNWQAVAQLFVYPITVRLVLIYWLLLHQVVLKILALQALDAEIADWIDAYDKPMHRGLLQGL